LSRVRSSKILPKFLFKQPRGTTDVAKVFEKKLFIFLSFYLFCFF
jgi:hypothetical protein